MAPSTTLQADYPWSKTPLIANGPMRLIAESDLATAVSAAGGLGFLGAGSDVSKLSSWLQEVESSLSFHPNLQNQSVLPVGIGFLLWAGDTLLQSTLPLLKQTPPAAVWLFAPSDPAQLTAWSKGVREATSNKTKIWIQIGTVEAALTALRTAHPDVLVIQGVDAGGHGLLHGSGLVPLLPEIADAVQATCRAEGIPEPQLVAAGGIMDSRGAAAALALGAEGIVLGTRYLAASEAKIAPGYQNAVLAAKDGGVSTQRVNIYDQLRGTTDWPAEYGGRGVLNASFRDFKSGVDLEENKKLYQAAVESGDEGWKGEGARLTTYAGAGVGLVKGVQGAEEITREVREGVQGILSAAAKRAGGS